MEISFVDGTNMSGYQVYLYNKYGAYSDRKTYCFSSNDVVVGSSGVNFWVVDTPGIQNGGDSPDGVALVDGSNNTIEFVSYMGILVGHNGPAVGMTSVDIHDVQKVGSIDVWEGSSVQRSGTGCLGSDFSTWELVWGNTRGRINVRQAFSCRSNTEEEEGGGHGVISRITFGGSRITRHYNAFTLEIECGASYGYAVRFSYELVGPDRTNFGRLPSYSYGEELPQECQQKSQDSYDHPDCTDPRQSNEYCFDRGNLVMSNHLDNSLKNIEEVNTMTNILPQAAGLNEVGGAWFFSELIVECARDVIYVNKQVVLGGALYTDESNDYFLESHGIPTPDYYWKVVIRYFTDNHPQPSVAGWVIPNHYTAVDEKLWTEYLTPVAHIKLLARDDMAELPVAFTEVGSENDWDVPSTCDRS